MSRARRFTLLALVVLGLLAVGLWALPEILRRVAVERLSKLTGRTATIEDVDLNLFTGRLALKGFRLAERDSREPFAEFERFDVQLGLVDLLRSHVRVREITLVAPSVRVVRQASGELNFSDLLAGPKEPAPEPRPGPSRWTVSIERARLMRGRVHVEDGGVAPPAEWVLQELELDARSLTTRAGAVPGLLDVTAKVNEARLALHAEPIRLDPLRIAARVTLEGFETRRLNEYIYIPRGTPYMPRGGGFGLDLTVDVDSDAQEIQKATVAGTLVLEREAFLRTGHPNPFLSASRFKIEIKEADLIARRLTLAAAELEGVDLAARRDARGVIDLIDLFTPKPPPGGLAQRAGSAPAAPTSAPTGRRRLFPVLQGLARGFEEIRIDRFTLAPSTVTFVDEHVKPPARLALTKLRAQADNFTWPVKAPMALTLSARLPGGGTLDIKGPMTVVPFDTELTVAIRDAPVEPYQPYIPIPARLSGRFFGDSRNRIAFRDGSLVAQSKGNSWGQNVEIREPGASRPAIRVERMELVGIDFDWPTRAAVVKAGFRRPRVEVERSADGTFNLRRLFAPAAEANAPPKPGPKAVAPAEPRPKSVLETMRLEFGEVRIEDGTIRFLDRTTQPAFSQDLSRLALSLTGYGNRPGRRAKVTLQSVVGGDAALDVRGEIGPLAAPADIDLVGELRSFKLPSVDPYASAAIGWVIKKGDLQYKVRFRLDGNRLSAENDVAIGQLQVAPASAGDEVKRRIGLPLGLIVALIKDQKGEIHANVPVTGTIDDPKFALSDAIWTAVKNVLVNIVTAPFKALGRLFSAGGGDTVEEPKVDPVTFAAGSAVLSPAMEDHLLRVADFLRRSPFVNLGLAPTPSSADADALRDEAVSARLRDFQRERGLDDAAAIAAYYKARLPDVLLPPTVDEQLALLREREPAPDARLAELGRRRVEATRERLVTTEGIPPARLTSPVPAGAAAPPPAPGGATPEGRVEFTVVAGE